jgi:ribosomal protein S28E/S33
MIAPVIAALPTTGATSVVTTVAIAIMNARKPTTVRGPLGPTCAPDRGRVEESRITLV